MRIWTKDIRHYRQALVWYNPELPRATVRMLAEWQLRRCQDRSASQLRALARLYRGKM